PHPAHRRHFHRRRASRQAAKRTRVEYAKNPCHVIAHLPRPATASAWEPPAGWRWAWARPRPLPMTRWLWMLVGLSLACGCGATAVRGTGDPDIEGAAVSTGLDRVDLDQMLDQNLSNLMGAAVYTRWQAEDRPTVAVLPFRNETSEHIS